VISDRLLFSLYSLFVPYRIVCPLCERIGVVRMERVITGGHCARVYECGRCLHSWEVTEIGHATKAPKIIPLRKPRILPLGPKSNRLS
jgi:hypothetical protein